VPNDVKAVVSVVTLLTALVFAYWEAQVAQAVPTWFVIGFAVFAVFAMWVFPEAGVKKGEPPKKPK
jgi:apolipoprotein N-acyltransferase